MRLRSYRNYVNVLGEDANEWRDDIKKKAHPQVASVGGRCGGFYTFGRSHRVVNHTIVHFQLRNLVWASSHNDVYTVYENCLRHYSPSLAPPLSSSFPPSSSSPPLKTLLDLSGGPLTPFLGINNTGGGGGVQISTLCVKDGWIAIGGFGGELILLRSKDINTRHDEVEIKGRISPPTFSTRLGRSDNGITNGIDIAGLGAGCSISPSLLSSNNDCLIRLLDLETFQLKHSHTFEWAINYGTMRPGGEALVAVVGDDPVTHLTDMTSGKTIAKLECHQDYSFACAWHPGGILLATGNQDTTAAVWDIRKTKEPLSRLVGSMGAIRSIRFSPDGRFMVMVEPVDFVHIVDVHSCFTRVQQVDFFGEIAGCSFAGEEDASSSLFIGIADMTYNSLLEYSRSSEEEEREAEREVAQSRAAAREAPGLEDAVSESEDEEMEDMEEEEGFVAAGEDQAEEGEGGQEVEEGGYEAMVEAAEEPMAIAQEEEEPWAMHAGHEEPLEQGGNDHPLPREGEGEEHEA